MKEIIKKIFIAVLVVAVIGAVASFALRSDEPDTTSQSTSSGDTSSTSAPAGNEVNGTTDSQGSTAPSQQTQNPSGSQDTTGSQGTSDTQTPQNTTTGANDPSQQATQSSQSQQSTSPSQGTDTPTSSAEPQQVNKIDRYQQIFKSGKFVMKVNDPELGAVTMAMNGNKMFVEASMEGITLKMLYDGDKPDEDNPGSGTWYVVIDKIKKYSPMPADLLGNMNVEDLTKDFAKGEAGSTYTKSVETVNGEQLDCESCTDANGNTTKYYFRGDVLVRSDSISPSGEISTTEFQEISSDVDESMFTIPSGYAKWDISWLIEAMG